jgi:hypothetical protein
MSAGNERGACNEKHERYKVDILFLTGALNRGLKLPLTRSEARIKEFCFESASLVFCTVSGSAKMLGQRMDLLLIDEAAQLKECESLIPLQLYGLKHAHYWKQRLCLVPEALGKTHKTLGKRFAECYTRQTTLGKKNFGKGRFAECRLSGTRQRLCLVPA